MWQTATFTTATSPVVWSNVAQNFDGYVLLVLAMPANKAKAYVQGFAPQEVPQRIKIPIVDGLISGTQQAFFTASLDPPNTLYAPFWFAPDDTLLYTPSGLGTAGTQLFSITGSPVTLAVPTLTAGAQNAVVPSVTSAVTVASGNGPYLENTLAGGTIGGLLNGTNRVFTISRAPSFHELFKNRQKLTNTLDYTLSGLTFTLVTAPQSGDVLEVVYWT